MRVFFSAGEASGDAYAAEILKLLQPEALNYFRSRFADFQHDMESTSSEELLKELQSEGRGLDSLDVVELVMAFEEEYDVHLPDDLAAGLLPKHDLMGFISRYIINDAKMTDIAFQAVGGRRLEEAGARIVADSSNWGAVGIVQSAGVSPRVIAGFYRAKAELRRGSPGVFVPIDFGFFNVKLARYAKGLGWKVLYFMPPGSWRKHKQGTDLPEITDTIVTPFPWSAEMLNDMGANAHYFGHPLKQMVGSVRDDRERTGIAILPGSRVHEIEQNIPVIARAIEDMDCPMRIALASNLDEDEMLRVWRKSSSHDPILSRDTYDVLKTSRAGVICSGTATLEAALCGCPCVVMYRGGWATGIEYRLRKPKFDYISLPNILLDKPLLKELIQEAATADAVLSELDDLMREGDRRDAVLGGFSELAESLGGADSLTSTANLVKALVSGDRS